VCFLFLDPQNEIGPPISSSVVLCSFVLLVYIVMLILVFCLCPSSVCVVATFPGTVLFSLLYSVLPFFSLIHWFFSLSSFVIPSKCVKNFICAASKRCSTLFFSTQASLPNFSAALAVMLCLLSLLQLSSSRVTVHTPWLVPRSWGRTLGHVKKSRHSRNGQHYEELQT